jgi:hypothetical protein
MKIKYPEIGICGLSCRLCPTYHTDGVSRCGGCKSEYRMAVGCPFITCAVKKKGIEYCGECDEAVTCKKWQGHREFSRKHDTFVCYQKLEDNIARIAKVGMKAFEKEEKAREKILVEMLQGFNEGRSKRYYFIAATVMEIDELRKALKRAKKDSVGMDIKGRSKLLHAILDEIADKRKYCLELRK